MAVNVLIVHSFLILVLLLLLRIISGRVRLQLFNRRGVQMIIGVYELLSNVNKSMHRFSRNS